jgi:hypothetical protein
VGGSELCSPVRALNRRTLDAVIVSFLHPSSPAGLGNPVARNIWSLPPHDPSTIITGISQSLAAFSPLGHRILRSLKNRKAPSSTPVSFFRAAHLLLVPAEAIDDCILGCVTVVSCCQSVDGDITSVRRARQGISAAWINSRAGALLETYHQVLRAS